MKQKEILQHKSPLEWTRKYLKDALHLHPKEERLRTDFNAWLPDQIIDCHAHANSVDDVKEIPLQALNRVYASFPGFTVEDSLHVRELLYPEKRVRTLRFANPYKGINHRGANTHLISVSPPEDRVALCGLPDDPTYTINKISEGNYTALKIYPYYFEPPAQTISYFFPDEILDVASQTHLPIIMHLPTKLSSCLDQVLEIIDKFPKLIIILAHMGKERGVSSSSLAAYEALRPHPSIAVDISMTPSSQLISQAFYTLGPERILFGSDEPFNLLRYKIYHHPELGERYVSQYPYHWLDNRQRERFGHLAINTVHLHWQVLMAIKTAITTVYPKDVKTIRNLVFYESALRVFPKF
jgi:hypothetical protein